MISALDFIKLAYSGEDIEKHVLKMSPKERFRVLNIASSKNPKTTLGQTRKKNLTDLLLHHHTKDRNLGLLGSKPNKPLQVPQHPFKTRQRPSYGGRGPSYDPDFEKSTKFWSDTISGKYRGPFTSREAKDMYDKNVARAKRVAGIGAGLYLGGLGLLYLRHRARLKKQREADQQKAASIFDW